MAYDVDFSDVTILRSGLTSASGGKVVALARPRFHRIGTAVRDNAKRNIKHKSGKLGNSGTVKTNAGGRSIETVIEFKALNNGFNYALSIEYGRRGFGPKNAKALRFEIGGKVIFTQWVGPAPAQYFLRRGLEQSMPVMVREFQALEMDIVRMIEAA